MDNETQKLRQWLAETASEPLEAMDGFFDARIGEYEAHMGRWARHYRWLAELLPAGTETLLDLGCGTGLELDAIFARFPEAAVTGLDLSREMLARLAAKHGARRLTLRREDYFAADLGENAFDAAVSVESLHHYPQERKTALFRKICRCLRPGGSFWECDYIAVTPEIEALTFAECARRRQRDGVPEGAFVHFDTPLTPEHELAALRDAGFSAVELVGFLPGDPHTAMLRAAK